MARYRWNPADVLDAPVLDIPVTEAPRRRRPARGKAKAKAKSAPRGKGKAVRRKPVPEMALDMARPPRKGQGAKLRALVPAGFMKTGRQKKVPDYMRAKPYKIVVQAYDGTSREIGPYFTRRGALMEAKALSLRIKHEQKVKGVQVIGGVQTVKDSLFRDQKKRVGKPRYKLTKRDVGYKLTTEKGPNRLMVQNPKRRKNTHLAVGSKVAYGRFIGRIEYQLPGDKYVVKFGSKSAVIAGRQLKRV